MLVWSIGCRIREWISVAILYVAVTYHSVIAPQVPSHYLVHLIDSTLTALGPDLVLPFSRLDVYRVLLRSLLRKASS
jgi:hypothetical protein